MKPLSSAQHIVPLRSVYYLYPLAIGSIERLNAQLERCRAMGFDHVATMPPFLPGPARDAFLAGDLDLAHPALCRAIAGAGASDHAPVDAVVGHLARACGDHGLRLLLDIVMDRVDVNGRLALSHPQLFHCANADPPDPRSRRPPVLAATARIDHPDAAKQFLALWAERLGGLLQVGVAGYRFLNPGFLPAALWRGLNDMLRGTAPNAALLAFTPGMDWHAIAALAHAGFDGVFSSLFWWDRRADWFADELDLLHRVAPVVACPEIPFGQRLSERLNDVDDIATAYRQALDLAAATGDALMIPAGFEYAFRQRVATWQGFVEDAQFSFASPIDLTADVNTAVQRLRKMSAMGTTRRTRALNEPPDGATKLVRYNSAGPFHARTAVVTMINPDLAHERKIDANSWGSVVGGPFTITSDDPQAALKPGEIRTLMLERLPDVAGYETEIARRAGLEKALAAPRIVIDAIAPSVDDGKFAAKRLCGDEIAISADIFTDGHGLIAADFLWRPADEEDWRRRAMRRGENDRWHVDFTPPRVGRHWFAIEAWLDEFAGLSHDIETKLRAGARIELDVKEAVALVKAAVRNAASSNDPALHDIEAALAAADMQQAVKILIAQTTREAMRTAGARRFCTRCEPLALEIERPQAGFGAWYELFPRSSAVEPGRHGTFDDVIRMLPRIRDMGFDVLYFPPVHPIGQTNRKGRNNNLVAAAEDPGSPYAIGSSDGGHDAIHPQLGSLDDFRRLVAAAADEGIEIAIDFAIQCSPDHPWLKQHRDWFPWRADGSMRFAENPPKKYEDIVNVEFYADRAARDLWSALRDVVEFWIDQGIRIFRVDNPHTKPLPFWQWLIGDIRARHPDTIFLSEAFTRPKMMYRLAKIGFSQSYTYFTWRNGKRELIDYLTELTTTDVAEYFRPHFFVNTPDINPIFLQNSGRAGFLIRAALAATLSGLWGIYSGFELCEAAALPGREEYLDSEKYEIKHRDFAAPGNIIAEIATLNRIRNAHPALHSHLGLTFYNAYNDQILVYGKASAPGASKILVAVSLDPQHVQEATFEIPLWEWGMADDGSVGVDDLIHDRRFVWTGKLQHVRLDPAQLPYAIWRIAPLPGSCT